MKIALANNLYEPYNRGGAENVVKKMAADFCAAGHEVFLITLEPKKKSLTKNIPDLEKGLKVYRLPSNYSRLAEFSLPKRLFWHLNDIFSSQKNKTIKKILIAENPDLFITHNLMGLGLSLPRILEKMRIRHEHYLHDIQLLHPSGLMMLGREKLVDSLSAKIYQYFTRRAFNSPAKVTSPSDWLLQEHAKRGFFTNSIKEVRPTVVGKIGAKNNYHPEGKNSQTKKFLFVGQIEYHKGILLLIKAFKKALIVNQDLELDIVGDGKLLEEAKKMAKENANIIFHGRTDSQKISALMSQSDYLIVPSLCYENSPTTIYEAHAVGLPVIAARIGGIPEITNHQDKLFEPGDIDDLKSRLLE